MKLSEAVNHVIELGRKIESYYHTEAAKRHKHYPLVSPGEEEAPPPPEEKELADFLATLPDEMIFQMLLIVYLWRMAYPADDLVTSYNRLKEEVEDDREYAQFMLTRSAITLADELTEGLELLRAQKINVDKLPLRKAGARKR